MPELEHINPRLLTWARESAGFSIPEAAQKLGLKDGVRASAAQKLTDIERGDGEISRVVLQKAASVFRRPLVTFYLAEPPRRGDRGEDYRAPSAGTISAKEDAMLDALVRDVRARQQIVKEILEDEEEALPRPFIASVSSKSEPSVVADSIRRILDVSTLDQQRARNPNHLFTILKTAAERSGIYVLLLGDLGSPHSDISEQVFRGFALADKIAPIAVINDNDAAAGRSFTLLHEIAHLWVGASGVSGPLRRPSGHAVERFCNDVASAFLLPPEALAIVSKTASGADIQVAAALSESIATTWNVSQGSVVYRFARNGWISDDVAGALFSTFSERWQLQRQRERTERDPDGGAPTHYQLRRAMVGTPLLNLVRRSIQDGTISRTKAARVLGVRPTGVDAMLERPKRGIRS